MDLPPRKEFVRGQHDALFEEYCFEYCRINCNAFDLSNPLDQKSNLNLMYSFVSRTCPRSDSPLKSVRCRSSTDSEDIVMKPADCPLSPTKEDISDLSFNDNESIMLTFEQQLDQIAEKLLSSSDNPKDQIKHDELFKWSLSLACVLCEKMTKFKVSPLSGQANTRVFDQTSLTVSLNFWTHCPLMQFLTKLIFDSMDKKDFNKIISKCSHDSFWIIAQLCVHLHGNPLLNDLIASLAKNLENEKQQQRYAAENHCKMVILSYISEEYPNTIGQFFETKHSLMLKLCRNSPRLLDLLAGNVTGFHFKPLNRLSEKLKFEDIKSDIMFCMMQAPNSFDLLALAFEFYCNPKASVKLTKSIMSILTSILSILHNYVFSKTSTYSSNDVARAYMEMLKDNAWNLSDLEVALDQRHAMLRKVHIRLISLVCSYYGTEFTGDVFHDILNQTISFNTGARNYEEPIMNNLLAQVFSSLRLSLGYSVHECIGDTLKLHLPKQLCFWPNLASFTQANKTINLPIRDLLKNLNAKSFSHTSKKDIIFKKYYIVKMLEISMDRNLSLYLDEQYYLCTSLVNTYFELLDLINFQTTDDAVVLMHTLVLCQRLLRSLSYSYHVNECIIARTVLELVQKRPNLFNENFMVKNFSLDTYHCVNLLKENLMKFRKVNKSKLLPFYKKHHKNHEYIANDFHVLHRQLVIDLLWDCSKNMQMLAKAFVSTLSKEVLQSDFLWLDEDPRDGQIQHFRVCFFKDSSRLN